RGWRAPSRSPWRAPYRVRSWPLLGVEISRASPRSEHRSVPVHVREEEPAPGLLEGREGGLELGRRAEDPPALEREEAAVQEAGDPRGVSLVRDHQIDARVEEERERRVHDLAGVLREPEVV